MALVMPIRERSSRTPDQAYRGLSAGHVRPSSISEIEAQALRLHCLKVVLRDQRKAQQAVRRNRLKIPHQYRKELRAGLAARLSAAWKAYGRADTYARRRLRNQQPLNNAVSNKSGSWQNASRGWMRPPSHSAAPNKNPMAVGENSTDRTFSALRRTNYFVVP